MFWKTMNTVSDVQILRANDVGQIQRLRKEGNGTINKVSAMRPGLAMIIEKVQMLTYFESPETDLHIVGNFGGINYPDSWSSKRVH
jgi:hypothetical protein